jgi:energy-coupling factor transporter transmembrane protein EcfT
MLKHNLNNYIFIFFILLILIALSLLSFGNLLYFNAAFLFRLTIFVAVLLYILWILRLYRFRLADFVPTNPASIIFIIFLFIFYGTRGIFHLLLIPSSPPNDNHALIHTVEPKASKVGKKDMKSGNILIKQKTKQTNKLEK